MKLSRIGSAAAALMAMATLLAPPSSAAGMQLGNYDLWTNRYTQASWFWFISTCTPDKNPDCIRVAARPRLKFYAYYESRTYLVDGRYTFTVDVPDGLRCWGHNMPTRETYSWDATTLLGTIDSKFDVGCNNGPPGTQFWTFKLQRL
ncbi:hypothetical protein [Mycolicibacterium hippocampi]|uniref:Secreted protein n=1 Tax=Mycolicibacterium hippocampi TaxID=659824 RepID=A0A7I9ZU94_9MYCO|nr:hypothetical protein [Mycolicibacterium hippocampi]GFH04297.1 hypothetical protein MHIP_47800 [Mycolicibacterium hippocampi]